MRTETSPCGTTVTVTAAGIHRLSELRDEAALAFAELHQRPVGWPLLVSTRETSDDHYAAVYMLEDGLAPSGVQTGPHRLAGV